MIKESLHYAVGKQMNQDIYNILSTITEEEQMILEGQNKEILPARKEDVAVNFYYYKLRD